ncbi:MAG: hypothetical protein LBT49_06245 [Prevotellaceae bacterium]|jgi:Leucine-rich repeat (LRR) protein|nr:hypothetical protein [Prevotellaceae bacterium]
MNKNLIILFIVTLVASAGLPCCKESPEVLIADSIFEAYCLTHFDKNGNGIIQRKEVDSIKSLDISGRGIQSLKGLEDFTSLEHLNCSNNQLFRLYLSKNKELTTVYCAENDLSSLDVSDNVNLHTLDCSNNHITVLNLSGNAALKHLNCANNPLIIINVWSDFNVAEYRHWNTPESVSYISL